MGQSLLLPSILATVVFLLSIAVTTINNNLLEVNANLDTSVSPEEARKLMQDDLESWFNWAAGGSETEYSSPEYSSQEYPSSPVPPLPLPPPPPLYSPPALTQAYGSVYSHSHSHGSLRYGGKGYGKGQGSRGQEYNGYNSPYGYYPNSQYHHQHFGGQYVGGQLQGGQYNNIGQGGQYNSIHTFPQAPLPPPPPQVHLEHQYLSYESYTKAIEYLGVALV